MNEQQQWAAVLSAVAAPSVPDRPAVLRMAVQLGLDVAPGSAGCSVTELTDSGYRTTVSANDLAVALDLAQYDAGAGPCLSAADHGSVQRLDDTVGQDRYLTFGAACAEHGVRSSLSVGLVALPRPAALNLYSSTPAAFAAARPRAVADLLARCVAELVHTADAYPPAPAEIDAVRSRRDRIRQAEAVLMASRRLGRADAFSMLTDMSVQQGRSIFDVAEDLLRDAGREDLP